MENGIPSTIATGETNDEKTNQEVLVEEEPSKSDA